MEQAVQLFFQWVVDNPELAKREIERWENT